MEILKEMTHVLFENDTISKVKEQNKSLREKVPIESHDISFRLFFAPAKNINLEVMVRDDYGIFFQPIGYYEFNNDGKLKNIYVLKEFEEAYKEIKHSIASDLSSIVKFLTLEENGYIATTSRKVSNVVKRMFNNIQHYQINHLSENIVSNGLKVQVKTSMMDTLEAVLQENDDLDLFMMYSKYDGVISIHHPSEDAYSRMFKKCLLSAFK